MTRLFRKVTRAVDRYWFAPASYRDLALVRIVVVGATLLFFYPSLEGQLRYAAAHPDLFFPIPALKVLLLPFGEWGIRPDPTLIHGVWLVGIVGGVGAVLGKYTRLSLLVHASAITFLIAHNYSYGTVHHADAPLVIALWVLAFSGCGRAWSLDSLQRSMTEASASNRFRRRTPADDRGEFARWPLVTIQWILSLAYLSAGASKLLNGGLDWFRSSTLAYFLVRDGIRHDVPLGITLAGYPELLTILAVGVVLIELTFIAVMVFPRVTWIYLAAGAAMHIGILVTQAAPFMQWVTLYVAFLPTLRDTFPGTWLRRRLERWRQRAESGKQRRTIIYDGHCTPCIRTMVVLDHLDPGNRLEPLDLQRDRDRVHRVARSLSTDEARHALHLVTPDGRLFRGFDVFRELTRALPLLWPLAPFTHAPLARSLGKRIHGAMSGGRARHEACEARSAKPLGRVPT